MLVFLWALVGVASGLLTCVIILSHKDIKSKEKNLDIDINLDKLKYSEIKELARKLDDKLNK